MMIAAALFSCNDNEESIAPAPSELSEQEEAELIAGSLSSDVQNLTSDLGMLGYQSENVNVGGRTQAIPECGETVFDTFGREYAGQFVSFDISGSYRSTLTCFLKVPTLLEVELNSATTTESQRILSSTFMDGNVMVELDDENLGNYLLNANLGRTGTISQKQGQQFEFNTVSTISLDAISINLAYIIDLINGGQPNSNLIAGGSAVYKVDGTGPNGGMFTVEASVVFNGDGTAMITINGKSWPVDLPSGELLL
jgi:hypothetical protein